MKKIYILLVTVFSYCLANGQAWVSQTSGVTSSLNSTFFTSSTTGLAVGDGGKIVRTTNGGTNWNTMTSGTTSQLNSVFFPSANTGYVVGGSGAIRKTTNGGTNWSGQTSGTTNYLYGVYFVDDNTGYAVGWSGTILKTTNGGTNWVAQTSNTTACLYAVYFNSANVGYAVGGASSGVIVKTVDGGTNWTVQTSGTSNILRSVYSTGIDTAYAAGDNGTLLKTTNGGTNWNAQSSGVTFSIHGIVFANDNLGYCVCSSGYFLKTINAGTNWVSSATIVGGLLMSVYFVGNNTGWAVGESGTIIKTTTGGDICTNTANAGANKNICLGSSVQLNATGGVSYSWSPSTGLSSTTISNPIANPTTTTVYTVTVTQANSCTGSDNVTVTVNAVPSANAGTDASIPFGTNTSLTGSGSGGSGSYTYLWAPSGSLVNATVQNPTTTNLTVTTVYTLTVTDASSGCTGTDQVTITITGSPLNVTSSATPSAICLGQNTQLNALVSGGSGSYTYSWSSNPAGFSSAIANPTAAPATTTTYTVSVNDGFNTSTSSVSVTVNPVPNANAGTDVSICLGAQASLNASGGTSYSWSPSTGLTATNINNPSASPAATTTYIVTVTSNGCTDTDDITVTVNPVPTADAGSDQTICFGESVTLTATGGGTYAWSGDVTNGVPLSPASSQTYYVTVTNGFGCSDIDSVVVTVNPLPLVDAGNDQEVCYGTVITLTATGNAAPFTWSDGVIDGVPFTPDSSLTYYVSVTDVNSCSASDSVNVVVNPLPDAEAGNDQTVCLGTTVTLSASGGINYSWSESVTNGIPFTPTESEIYIVTVTDINGCSDIDSLAITVNPLPVAEAGNDQSVCAGAQVILSATGGDSIVWDNGVNDSVPFIPAFSDTYYVTVFDSNACSATDSVFVEVLSLPVADAGADQVICSGDSVILSATGNGQYSWSGGVLNDVPFAPVSTSTYVVTVTDTTGCADIDSVLVTVNAVPATPVISLNGDVLTSDAIAGNQWYLNDTLIAGATGQSDTVLANGSYYVIVTLDGCVSDTSNIITTSLGIQENYLSGSFILYPNPASDFINLEIIKHYAGSLVLSVENLQGQTVIKQELNSGSIFRIDVSGLDNGIYFLILSNDNANFTGKIIIER